MKAEVAVKLDMSGLSCPLPLLGAKKILDDLPDGQQMMLISDCPGTGDDLRVWAGITGHEIISTEPLNGKRVEGAARTVIEGRAVKNIGSLANPECLDEYRSLDRSRAA